MGTSIRCWKVSKKTTPQELEVGAPELEEHFEDWVENSAELIDPSLLIIGRQIERTDLLAIDDEGQLVIIELKRDLLPRLVLEQALEYASMVATWTPERVVAIAEEYLGKSIYEAFEERFEKSLEDTGGINSDQRIILIGCRTDSTLERMVNWLSDREIPINVITLSFFVLPDGQNILVRSLLVSEEVAKAKSEAKKGRRAPMNEEKIKSLIDEKALEELVNAFDTLDQTPAISKTPGLDGIDYKFKIPREDKPPLRRTAVQLLLTYSKKGQLKVGILANNFAELLDIEDSDVLKSLQEFKWIGSWRREIYLSEPADCRKLSNAIAKILEGSRAVID